MLDDFRETLQDLAALGSLVLEKNFTTTYESFTNSNLSIGLLPPFPFKMLV